MLCRWTFSWKDWGTLWMEHICQFLVNLFPYAVALDLFLERLGHTLDGTHLSVSSKSVPLCCPLV